MAMLDGGPTTVFGTLSTVCIFGENVEKSRIETESGAVAGITRIAPVFRSTLFSLPEIINWARVVVAETKHSRATQIHRVPQAKEIRIAPSGNDDSQRGDFISGDFIAVVLEKQSQRHSNVIFFG